MRFLVCLVLLGLVAAPCRCVPVSGVVHANVLGDMTTPLYKRIDRAMAEGNVAELPKCGKKNCPRDLRLLLQAAASRIQWRLKDSFHEAGQCAGLAGDHHVFTLYACARLAYSDAFNLDGYHGRQLTDAALSDAVRKVCAEGLCGDQRKGGTSLIEKQTALLRHLRLPKEKIEDPGTVISIPLMGSGHVNHYVVDKKRFDKYRKGDLYPTSSLGVSYPAVTVQANGKRLLMTVDTDAQTSSIHTSAAKRVGLSMLPGVTDYTTDGAGNSVPYKMGLADTFDLGGVKVRHMYLQVIDADQRDPTDGVIGLDLLDKLGAVLFTRHVLLIHPHLHEKCDHGFTMSSNFIGRIFGIRLQGVTLNGAPVIAVPDTGNATEAVGATPYLAKRMHLAVHDLGMSLFGGPGGRVSVINDSYFVGKVDYLGERYSGPIRTDIRYPGSAVDLNIGMPSIYGRDLYINFDTDKICLWKAGAH